MASFVNYGETKDAPNYVSRSRGTDTPKASSLYGTLFEGMGTLVNTTVKAVDANNVQNINTELQTGIDAIRGAQGVDAAVNDPTVTGGETGNNVPSGGASAPPGVAAATSEIARINQAYKDGKIGDTYYYAKVESLARQVRAKYPGYRDEIDKKVSSVIGTNPANALRSSLLQDLKQAQSTAQSRANADDTIIERGKEYLSGEKYNNFIRGNRDPAFVAEMKMDIQQGEAKKQQVSSLKQEYELKKTIGQARTEDLEKVVTRESSDTVIKILNDGIESAGGGRLTLESLNQKIAGMASGAAPTAEEMGALRAGVNALITQADAAVTRVHSTPWGKDGAYTYQQEIKDPEALKRIKEQALAPIRAMEKALTDGDVGMFTWHANQAKLMKNQTTQDIFARSQTVRNLAAAQEALGPAFGQLLLESGVFSKAAKEVAQVLTMDSLAKSAAGNTDAQTILRDGLRESRATNNPNDAKETAQSILTTTKNTLANTKISDTALANTAKTWFNPDRNFITDRDIFTENSRMSVIQMLSSPEVVTNMGRLKSANPEVWGNYKRWVESSTQSVFSSTVGQLSTWATPGSGYMVTVDQQGRVNLARDPSLKTDQFTAQVDRSVQAMNKSVGQLNSAIDARRRIGQADGEDPAAVGRAFVQALGLKLTPGGEGKANPPGTGAGNAPENLTADPASLSDSGLYSGTPIDQLRSFVESPRVPENLKVIMRQELSAREGGMKGLTPETQDLFVELERGGAIDLEARDQRRAKARFTSDPTWQNAGASIPQAADLRVGILAAAKELGIDPVDLATVISYETGGTFDPSIRGGAGNRHIGLIQFGPTEQQMYGASQQQSAGEQLQAVVKYLKHRGFKPGMDILDLYSTINAGSPGRYGASDANNGGAPGTVRDKVQNQMGGHRRRAQALLASQ